MTFPVSPGVYNKELDYSTIVPALGTTVGATCGVFAWGPMFQPTLVTSQIDLEKKFWTPKNWNYETWYSAFNFLQFGKTLYVVRTANTTTNTTASAYNAICGAGFNPYLGNSSIANAMSAVTFNKTDLHNKIESNFYASIPNIQIIAKYPGALGNSLRVGFCKSATEYHSVVALGGSIANGISAGNTFSGTFTTSVGSRTGTLTFLPTGGSSISAVNTFIAQIQQNFIASDLVALPTGIRSSPTQYLRASGWYSNAVVNSTAAVIPIIFTNGTYKGASNLSISTLSRYWEFANIVKPSPTSWVTSYSAKVAGKQDQILGAVIDFQGAFTGVPNTILETYTGLSRATDALNDDGTGNYYRTVINETSKYISIVNDVQNGLSNTAANLVSVANLSLVPWDFNMTMGQDGASESTIGLGDLINGWTYFEDIDKITIDLVFQGKAVGSTGTAGESNTTYNNFGLASWLINNIAETRRDCVVFFTSDKAVTVNNVGNEVTDLVNWASLLPSSSYAFYETGYKYQYDQYNNAYRWIPMNGDIAGLCVYNDSVGYPWTSPAGFNRGQIPNVTKLAYNPSEGERDILYPNAVNPVVSFPGKGTYLYGDKTFTTQPSGFSRLNVRRLFVYVERAVKAAAQYTLFELNDSFTQNQFKNMVVPYLRTIQGQNGIYDFDVVCGPSVNTPQVVDGNQFLCAIYIKPTKVIDFIQISYINTPSGISFSTVENSSVSTS